MVESMITSGAESTSGELDTRCHDLLSLVSLSHKAHKLPRDLTQVEMRKLELARACQLDRRFKPRMAAATRESLYRGWRTAVSRVRSGP
jgi:hypothetical protein